MDEAGQRLRADIDNIDNALIDLLAERFDAVAEMHLWKLDSGLPMKDLDRESTIRAKYVVAFGEKDGNAFCDVLFDSK